MKSISVLDQNTIDKIAAGEVIERPVSVVKELVENAIDAGANAITVEIKEGGISMIRITDNGEGIEADQVPLAFLRHATSKITKVEDLLNVTSLGFRGEALSSIAAVCQVELISKTAGCLTGIRYLIEGGQEKGCEEVGAPDGTTFLVRNLFFNTPARKKFLKSAVTEAGYISDLMERMALSHPDIAFKFINNNQIRLHTSGNTNLKDIIYGIYGRDIAYNLVKTEAANEHVSLSGYIGKPIISRGNRNYENYFINGRYVKSSIITKAIEEAYKTFMMQHKYPFTSLHFTIDGALLDINVHPTKMELRFADNEEMYRFVYEAVRAGLTGRELIQKVTVAGEKETAKPEIPKLKQTVSSIPEPFEKKRLEMLKEHSVYHVPESGTKKHSEHYVPESGTKKHSEHYVPESGTKKYSEQYMSDRGTKEHSAHSAPDSRRREHSMHSISDDELQRAVSANTPVQQQPTAAEQLDLFEEKLLSKDHVKEHKMIGQIFGTYWLVQFQDSLYIIDQHAAHEKVLYERTMKSLDQREYTSQQISPPMILTLSMQEESILKQFMENFNQIGFEIEHFGGSEYSIRAVPGNLFGISQKNLFIEMLDSLSEQLGRVNAQSINERIASMSCKAAVKGNHNLSAKEMEALIDELLTLDNPYNCPHGRPTIISMTKYELEKKFKRIV